MKLKPGVLLALQQQSNVRRSLYDIALGSHPECMAVVTEDDKIVGYNFYGFPDSYLENGTFKMPCEDPGHLVEVAGYPAMRLSDLLARLASERSPLPLEA